MNCCQKSENVCLCKKITDAPLAAGAVRVYDFGRLRLHAYETKDPMTDECFVLETENSLLGIEAPAFNPNIEAWFAYLRTLNKPFDDLILSCHPSGIDSRYRNMNIYATQKTVDSMTGGAIKGLNDNFIQVFGKDFNGKLPEKTLPLKEGPSVIAGVGLNIIGTDEGCDIEIPELNIIYTHMMGGKAHAIMPGIGAIDAMIAKFEAFRQKGYALILSSHTTPETPDAADDKIAYLKKARGLAQTCRSREEFLGAMIEAFPDHTDRNYLEMSAGFLFP